MIKPYAMMYRFVETKRLTSHWEFEPDPLVGVPLVSTRSRLFRVAVVSFPWVTFPAGLPLPATVSVDKNAGNTNRGIRSSDNDSTGFWPPGSLRTLGADGHI